MWRPAGTSALQRKHEDPQTLTNSRKTGYPGLSLKRCMRAGTHVLTKALAPVSIPRHTYPVCQCRTKVSKRATHVSVSGDSGPSGAGFGRRDATWASYLHNSGAHVNYYIVCLLNSSWVWGSRLLLGLKDRMWYPSL